MIHVSNTHEWKRADGGYQTPEGLLMTDKELKDVCGFYKIPATLINVDNTFKTQTLLDVVRVAAPKVQIIEQDGMIQVLDPKSNFVSDEEFNLIIEQAQEKTGLEFTVDDKRKGIARRISFKTKPTDTDSFVGDVFEKSIAIERLPQGGINLSTALLRLVCTNGMILPDAQYKSLIRSGLVDAPVLTAFSDAVKNFNVDEYFKNLFFKNGEALHASVSDYLGMKQTLKGITDGDDLAEILFPMDGIKQFYEAQGISLDGLSRATLNKLPSGLRYYEAFNILTHGAKSADKTLENEIRVASWCRPSYLSQIKNSDVVFKGMPHFDSLAIKERMGDIML